MRYVLVAFMALILAPVAVHAQWGMGPEGMGGMGMGMGMSPTVVDTDPVWSPDGNWIAFTRGPGQVGAGGGRAAIISATRATPAGQLEFINNLRPLAWEPDSSGLICGYGGGQHATSQYNGFWRVDRADRKQITLIMLATNPKFAAFSPDGEKLLLVDERGADLHEIYVSVNGADPRSVYTVRGGEKFVQAGWNHASDAIWFIAEVAAREEMARGTQLPEDALRAPAMGGMMPGMMDPGMMDPGMMGPGMMGPGMMDPGMMMPGMMDPGMMGPGMMPGMMGHAPPQARKVMFLLNLADRTKSAIGEAIEAAAWSPTEPQIVVHRKIQIQQQAPAGMGPGMMMPGMMDPGMMGMEMGMMMGGMGPTVVTQEYLALRGPEPDADETLLPDPSMPITHPIWSDDGRMISGASSAQRRVFTMTPPRQVVLEAAQNFDEAVQSPRAVAWSPDGTKLVYSGIMDTMEGNDRYIIRGLFVAEVDGTEYTRLTENKTRAMQAGMMGPGMMDPGMMGAPGMWGMP